MPNPPGTKTVGFTARGDLLAEIDRRVAAGSSVSAAVQQLAEAGLAAIASTAVAQAEHTLLDLASLPLADLLDEVRARVEVAESSDVLRARAEAAEAKLAAIAGVMAPASADAS